MKKFIFVLVALGIVGLAVVIYFGILSASLNN